MSRSSWGKGQTMGGVIVSASLVLPPQIRSNHSSP